MQTLRYFWILLLSPLLCLAQPAPADAVPVESFFRHPTVLDVELSQSGRYLALISVRDDARASLLVVDLQSTAPARVVASYKKQDVVEFHWVGDEYLLYRLGNLEPGRVQKQGPGLFAVDVNGSRTQQLICSEIESCHRQTEMLKWYIRLLQVPLRQPGVRPHEVIVGGLTPEWLDIRNGLMRRVEMPERPKDSVAWWFNSRGEPRLVLTVDENRRAFHWLAPGASQWRRIAEFDLVHTPFWPQLVGDDGQLYITHQRGAAGERVMTTFDFDKGAPAEQALVQVPGFDFEGQLLQDETSGALLGVHVEADAGSTVWFDAQMKAFQDQVDRRWPDHVNRVSCRRCGRPDMVALVHSGSDRDPGRYRIYRAATQRWETVAVAQPGIDPKRMAGVELQRIRARDGRDLPVWLTRPSGRPAGEAAPAVVLVHGGPWVRGGYWAWDPMAQFLASRGYLVITPEFRGSTGYGEAHFEAGFRQWGQAMQDDVADALLWARKQGLATDRACIAGGSYGGYATLMGLARHPELYRCGVAWVAVADLPLYLEGGFWVWDDISALGRRYVLPELVGDSNRDKAMLTAASPLAQAERIRAPLLLAYGEEDVRVPIEHGKRLRDALAAAGRPPQWVSYPGEGHGWQKVATRVDFARRFEDFLRQHLLLTSRDAAVILAPLPAQPASR